MAYEYESKEVRALRSIDSKSYNKDFSSNLIGLNNATDYMAQYMIVMQKGIDDANKDIIQKIQDFINDLIIIFGGGEDTGFEFGDLKYIIQALGALFGFQGLDGPANLLGAGEHFFENFLSPLGVFGDVINGFIKTVFQFFAGLLSNVPIVGNTLSEIVTNTAGGINTTTATANDAHSTAQSAQSTANTANTNAATAQSAANTANSNAAAASAAAAAAQTAASDAVNTATAAQTLADKAYANAVLWNMEFVVSSAGVYLGKNEEDLGVLMTVPNNGQNLAGIITSVVYTFKSNNGSAVLELIRRTVAGVESVILTTNIPANATIVEDNSIDFQITHLDHIMVNVKSISSGAVLTTLHCHLDCIYVEQP